MQRILFFIALLLVANFAAQAQTIRFKQTFSHYDEAADTIKINVYVTARNASPSSANVSLVSGFGTADANDFLLLTPSVTFTNPGADTQFVYIKILNDAAKEAAEYFAIQLTSPTNATINASNGKQTIYIKDNDYTAPVARKNIDMQYKGSYTVPYAGSSAEIVAYDSAANRLYVVNSLLNIMHILNFANPSHITEVDTVHMGQYGGGINSIAVRNGIVAVAVEASPKTDNGKIVFFDANGAFLKEVPAGALPDMVTFTPDGKYVLTANEGEPNNDYSIDPEGSVTIVDLSNGVQNATATNAGFAAYNGQENALRSQGIRIYGVNATAAKDFEPEYITVSAASDKAWVTLQENNAIAVVDLSTKTITDAKALGYSDHAAAGFALDASDNNGEVLIANWPVRGLHLPDAIASYNVGGNTYLITANEGDAREYAPLTEEARIGSGGYVLDPTIFPNADLLKATHNLGRLNAVKSLGDTDNDGDFDEIYVMGSRSFTIWNGSNLNKVYDNGENFEQIIKADPTYGNLFNADNGSNARKNRSDNKGPEPEGVAVGTINDTTYAFVALERVGGIMVYDVTTPQSPVFVQYINTRSNVFFGGDQGTEGIVFMHADANPHHKHYVVTANEVSGSIGVFEVNATQIPKSVAGIELPRLNVYPNPANDVLYFSQPVTGVLVDMYGKAVANFANASNINISSLAAGTYIFRAEGFKVEKVIIQ